MEVLTLVVRILFAVLFLSTAISKLQKMEQHKVTVQEYKILPPALVPLFSRMDVLVECVAGVLFALGLFTALACGLALALLLAYTVAIAVNLLRGRNNISCGCGGVVGNHHLSWWLVLRNLAFMLVAGWLLITPGILGSVQALFEGEAFSTVFGWSYFFTLLISLTVMSGYLGANTLLSLRNRIEALFQGL